VDDQERAHKYLTDEFAMKGGIVSQRDEDILAAEFAAVRREERVKEREACAKVCDGLVDENHRMDINDGREECAAAIRDMNEEEK
jgi:hypothetical protein